MEKDDKAKPGLTVLTVNWFSTEYLHPLFQNILEKSEFPEKIKFLIIDNTNGKDEGLSRIAELEIPVDIHNFTTPGKTGSFAHADALNAGLTLIDTEYTLIVDPDIYIFLNHFDTFIIRLLKEKNVFSAGTTYPKWQLGKYHNFPNPVFCFFKTSDYRNINADWTPYSKNPLVNLINFLRRQLLRCGIFINRKRYQKYPAIRIPWAFLERLIGVCSPDTGCRIAKNAKRNNIKSILFRAVLPDDAVTENKTDAFKQLAQEFELYYYQNEPVLTHKYSTCSKVWRTSKGADKNLWHQCIEQFQTEMLNTKRTKN